MELLKKIKENIVLAIINGKTKKQQNKKSFYSLKTAENIGILFDSNNIYNFEAVSRFKEELADQGKSVQLLGYSNSKKAETEEKDFLLFHNSDIKISTESINKELNTFLAQPFDLLLVLNNESSLAARYAVNLSNAHCKIGALKSCYNALDFIIEMPEPASIDKLITEIKKYIT